MQSRPWRLAMIAAVLLLSGTAAWAEGDFYVVAGGGGLGTKISSVPYEIKAPGFYYLGGTLTHTGDTNAIEINANDVTLDLMGFSLTHTGAAGEITGINLNESNNVEIRNGTVRGFSHGIFIFSSSGHARVINVRAINNINTGIDLGFGKVLVHGCTVSNSDIGINVTSGTVSASVACNNGLGICMSKPGNVIGNSAINNTVYNFYLGSPATKTPILVDRNSASGLATNYVCATDSTGVVITANNAGTP